MSVSLEDAKAQATALETAAKESPVRQYKYPLDRQAQEWRTAVSELEGSEHEAVIELASSVVNGMRVFTGERGWCLLLRTIVNGGQFTLHIENPDDPYKGIYQNLSGPTAPVVVKK